MSYRSEPWFAMLSNACSHHKRSAVAAMLGVSDPVVSQVLNGTGKYGAGTASTKRLADRVLHTFGRYPCPHLTEQAEHGAGPVVITAEQCRAYAHRPPPTNGPRDMRHWQACQACPHKSGSAPPPPREPKPRKSAAEPMQEQQGASDADSAAS